LHIYDGYNTTAPLIVTYSGYISPGIVTSSGTALTLRFISAGSVTYVGWAATISCPNSPVPVITFNGPICVGSDLIINASGGDSYDWPGPYGFHQINKIF
jgi:hypothetical protein